MKKPIWIIIIILAMIAVGVGLFFAWQNARRVVTPPGETTGGISGLPEGGVVGEGETEEGGELVFTAANKISPGAITDYWISQTDSGSDEGVTISVYYLDTENRVWKVADSEPESIISLSSPVISINANPTGDRVILESEGENGNAFSILNIFTGDTVSFANAVESMDWSPSGSQVAYLERLSSGNAAVAVESGSATRRNKTTIVSGLGIYDRKVMWKDSDTILLLPKPTAFYSDQIYAVSIQNKTFSAFGVPAAGIMFSYDSVAKQGLMFSSTRNGKTRSFVITSDSGETLGDIGFFGFPAKCAAANGLYCFIPRDIPTNLAMPDDYLQREFYSIDDFYHLDVENNALIPISISEPALIDADRVEYATGEVYFINRYDNALYSLQLPTIME